MGYRPFIDPISLHEHWFWLLLPMALGVSIVYKAIRLRDMERYWRAVMIMTVQIVVGMIVLGIASYLLVAVYVQLLAERAAGS
ncbi:MAG: hypothetical protein KF768_07655 [Phycisphaeraceae bacterium]|nr:hypothetical protein [Phycisphaeraceae bacterium]